MNQRVRGERMSKLLSELEKQQMVVQQIAKDRQTRASTHHTGDMKGGGARSLTRQQPNSLLGYLTNEENFTDTFGKGGLRSSEK